MSDYDSYNQHSGPSIPPPAYQPTPPPLGLGAKLVLVFLALAAFGGIGQVLGCGDSGTEGLEQAEQRLNHSGRPTYLETKEYLCQQADFRDDPSC